MYNYLERNGLEVKTDLGRSFVNLTERLGDLRTRDLMDAVLDKENFKSAVDKVVGNGGAEGMDGMSVLELPAYVEQHWDDLYTRLRTGLYKPKPVRRVVIPKPDGGERNLGVPTVLDRAIQQAIAQVLTGIYEPKFSERSFGFRPGRSCHDAIETVLNDCDSGYFWAVDIDLSKYFDTINHNILMNILRRDIEDETLLVTIKKFLKSGVMVDGVVQPTEQGSPQGGNLSPLLANIYLNELDKTLEERGHRFVRYADDLMVLCKSEKRATRTMERTRRFLENTLKLRVNEEKSQVAEVYGLRYLGFTINKLELDGKTTHRIGIHPKSVSRFKTKIRNILRKNLPITVEESLKTLKVSFTGWINYYGFAKCKCVVEHIMKWARRKTRAKILKQWKRTYRRGTNLINLYRGQGYQNGRISYKNMWNSIKYDSIWEMAANRDVQKVLGNKYLESLGFPDMLDMYEEVHSRLLNRRIRVVRTVV